MIDLKLLLAVGHAELQKFIAQDNRVEISDIVNSVDELYESLKRTNADTIIFSRYLKGNYNPRQALEQIKSSRPKLRIIYLYGQEDQNAKAFIDYLSSMNIADYHVGANISSDEVSRILFGQEEIGTGIIRNFLKRPAKTLYVRQLDTAVITIYSNSSNGKSHLAWNLANALSKGGYSTTLINMDRGFSANLYFKIDEQYYDLLDYLIAQQDHKNILDSCFKKGNLHVITGRLGNEASIDQEDFLKFLYFARARSDIVIIDTYTGLNDTTLQAINNSSIDFLMFDCDLMHFHMNMQMIEKLGSTFIENKTFAVINNCSTGSEAYKYIYKQINKLNLQFRGILPLSNCGSLGCDLMYTDRTSYEAAKNGSSFRIDINNLLKAIHAKNISNSAKHILKRGQINDIC